MTRYSISHIAGLFALAAASLARPAEMKAQVRRLSDGPDSVPRALVEALIDPLGMTRMIAGGRPRLVVGAVPSGLAQRFWIPPGATVLGGMESSGLGVVVIHSTLPRDSLIAGYRREQPRLGWTAPQDPQPRAMMGFVPAAAATTLNDQNGTVFCSGGTTLSIGVAPVDPGTWEINATAIAIGTNDRCQPVTSRVAPAWRAQYPTLTNPPSSGNGFGQGCAYWNSSGGGGSTRLQTTMTLDDVLAHYGKQLADSGWTPTGTQTTTRGWSRRDSTGAVTEIVLTAQAQTTGPSCVDVRMEVRSRRPS
jgi:hypothetical protein